jgi:Cd(II)/Pb(II)-responsive transcriptional regulator
MKIGELARVTGTPVQTIRFYEREGVLASPARTQANYRVYQQAHADRLAFVRHCRSLDMTLDEVRALLRFKDAPSEDCGEVDTLLDEHIDHVAQRIRELRALQKDLKALRCMCDERHATKDCGILQGLTRASRRPSVPHKHAVGHVQGSHR